MCRNNHTYAILKQGGCGVGRAVPVDCGDPLCVDCERQRAKERQTKWLPVLRRMKNPRFMTLTIRNGYDLAERNRIHATAFRKLYDLRLGPRAWPELKAASMDFSKMHHEKLFEDGTVTRSEVNERISHWSVSLDKFGETIQGYKSKRGKWPRVRDVMGRGFASYEVTYSPETGWHVHRHCVTSGYFIPWPLLAAAWLRVTKGEGFVVDIRAVDKTDKSIKEMCKYITKSWELPKEKLCEFRAAIRGVKRVWPLGGAKPGKPETLCPYCGKSDCKAEFVSQGVTYATGKSNGRDVLVLQDRDGDLVYFLLTEGRWRATPLEFIDKDFACHSQATRGP